MENRWGEKGNSDIIFLGSKITVDGKCSHEIKRHLLLGRKTMTNLDSILKSRDIVLSTKVCLVKAMVFPVVMYGCESWTIKKAEGHKIDAFELWCWRRLLRVPWTARRLNQSILKEINSKYSLEGLMLKLKLQYFGNLMQRANLLEKSLMLGKIEGRRRRGQKMMRWLDGITDSRQEFEQTPGDSGGQGSLVWCSPWDHKESDITKCLKNNKEQQKHQKSTSFVNVTAITTKTGKKFSEPFFFSELWELTKGLPQLGEYLIKRNYWISVRTESSVEFWL